MSKTFRTLKAELFKFENDGEHFLTISLKPINDEKSPNYVGELSIVETMAYRLRANSHIETVRHEWAILECNGFRPLYDAFEFHTRAEEWYNGFLNNELKPYRHGCEPMKPQTNKVLKLQESIRTYGIEEWAACDKNRKHKIVHNLLKDNHYI